METLNKLKKRAEDRKKVALRLLYISLAIIVSAMFIIAWQLRDIADRAKIIDIALRLSFMIFVFFISQILLRLYKYNMLTSDFYGACCDALEMSNELEKPKQEEFIKLIKVLNPGKITLDVPESPTLITPSDLVPGK